MTGLSEVTQAFFCLHATTYTCTYDICISILHSETPLILPIKS